MVDAGRIDDLRRRIQKDPASIAFAQLAEELRRAGHIQESIDTCRAGLTVHPTYLSARVTLGRALLEANDLDAAQIEMEQVLASAADNLAAIRALGDIHRRRGALESSLERYRTALELAPNDPDLEDMVAMLSAELAARPADGRVDTHAGDQPATSEPPVAVSFVSEPATPADDRLARTVAELESWLDAIHVARADGRA